MMKETKIVFFIGITMIILLFVIYSRRPNESNFKWPRWLKLGGCKPCVGSAQDGCCGGCLCQNK